MKPILTHYAAGHSIEEIKTLTGQTQQEVDRYLQQLKKDITRTGSKQREAIWILKDRAEHVLVAHIAKELGCRQNFLRKRAYLGDERIAKQDRATPWKPGDPCVTCSSHQYIDVGQNSSHILTEENKYRWSVLNSYHCLSCGNEWDYDNRRDLAHPVVWHEIG